MTRQSDSIQCLGGSPAGVSISRLCTLTLAVILATCGATTGFAQDQPVAAKPAPTVPEKKTAIEPAETISHNYLIHQSLEVGGRITDTSGSSAMWSTLFNQSSGGRILGQSLEMHSVNPSKTPFFDTLSTSSTGYGGDPYDVSRFRIGKGRFYDFAGTFRRDRQYFDYNLLTNSLLGPTALVPEPDSLHLYNTVRRNTDTLLTLMPLSIVSIRAGFNHGTHEGPSFTSAHDGGDVQLMQWFRNGLDTYTGGVDVKVAKQTTLSYDQFYVLYKGDSSFQLAGANYKLSDGTPVSLGVDTLSTATCGSGANKAPEVVNGVANRFCSGSTVMSQTAPSRTTFTTEQFRFSSHYWDRISMNGRFAYSGGINNVERYNGTFTGYLSRTFTRQEIDTGGLANGRLAHNKRVNVNADYAVVADLGKYVSVSDALNFWSFRVPGSNSVTSEVWAGTSANNPPGLSMLTPLSSLTPTTTTTTNFTYLNQKNIGNTVLGIVTITPQVKLSGGWRFNARHITDYGPDDLKWHQNGMLLGAVIQPSRVFRLNLNYDDMRSKNNGSATPSNTYTREAPNKSNHFRARAIVKPVKWFDFAFTSNDHWGKNDDPLVNHTEHSRNQSFAATVRPMEGLSLDVEYAHDDVFSKTDLCYVATPVPSGAANSGTCVSSISGSSTLLLGDGYYDAPANFISAAVAYAPSKAFKFNGGVRLNTVNGTSEELNPLMVPGALHSKYLTPFSDLEVKVASQWAWHGNWMHDAYTEQGPQGPLPSRNTHGDVVTLGVKYAF